MVPTTEEGIAILTNASAEIADSGAVHENDDDAWLEDDTAIPKERYRRYVQSSQGEVSDPDEWADGGREGRDPGADGDGATSSTMPRSWDHDG